MANFVLADTVTVPTQLQDRNIVHTGDTEAQQVSHTVDCTGSSAIGLEITNHHATDKVWFRFGTTAGTTGTPAAWGPGSDFVLPAGDFITLSPMPPYVKVITPTASGGNKVFVSFKSVRP